MNVSGSGDTARVEFDNPEDVDPGQFTHVTYRFDPDRFDPPETHDYLGERVRYVENGEDLSGLDGAIELINGVPKAAKRQQKRVGPELVARLASESHLDVVSVDDIAKDRQVAYFTYEAINDVGEGPFLATPDGEIFVYSDGIWRGKPDGEQRLRELGRRALRDHYGENILKELKEQVRSANPVARERLGAPPGKVVVQNGLLDLTKAKNDPQKALRKLEPDDHALNRLGAEYDPEADCRIWIDEFLASSTRPEDIDKLQEYAGYCLHHWGQPFKKSLLLVGPRDSGKSTFSQTLRKLLGGQDNVASETLYDLVSTRWGPAQLFGKIANVRNEITAAELRYPHRFKELTGGEEQISAEFKGRDKFRFVVTQKFVFTTNQVPDVEHADEAFYDRWLFATFPNSIPPDEQDELLAAKLEGELPGILNWAIEGYHRLRERGHFANERGVDDKRQMWEEHGDTIGQFKAEVLELTGDASDSVPKSDVYAYYTAFCDYIGQEAVTQTKLTRELKTDDQIGDKEQSGTRYYTGLQIAKKSVGGRRPVETESNTGQARIGQ